MLCHKIVHIKFQRKRNYVFSMILQISVQRGTRAASIEGFPLVGGDWGDPPLYHPKF